MSDGEAKPESGLESRAEYYKNYPEALKSFEALAKYRPDLLNHYLQMREAALNQGPRAAIPLKYKELIIIAIQCAVMKTNPPPVGHARRAIDAGATIEEIAEAVTLTIPLAGMMSYQESGRWVLEGAEAYLKQREAIDATPEQATSERGDR